jgi:hypothetical protein
VVVTYFRKYPRMSPETEEDHKMAQPKLQVSGLRFQHRNPEYKAKV